MFYPLFLFCLALSLLNARDSITSEFGGYREISKKASTDPDFFQNFRNIGEFRVAFELPEGDQFSQYILGSQRLMSKLPEFRRLDTFGSPHIQNFPQIEGFSPTTLRYICIADQICKMTPPPKNSVIVEIGAGFGGQCYILRQLIPFSHYYFIDLPEVELLIEKVMKTLGLENTTCIPMDEGIPADKIDLVISNYAFSECNREIQLGYFDRVIKRASKGFIIFNQIAQEHQVDSLSLEEFVSLLKSAGIKPRVQREILSTAPGNYLITWKKLK